MSYLELLGGLHRGARFFPKDGRWTVGSGDTNSVLLLDDDIPDVLLELVLTDGGFAQIQYADSDVFLMGSADIFQPENPLYNNTCFSVGDMNFRLSVPAERATVQEQHTMSSEHHEHVLPDADAFANLLASNPLPNRPLKTHSLADKIVISLKDKKWVGLFITFIVLVGGTYFLSSRGGYLDANANVKHLNAQPQILNNNRIAGGLEALDVSQRGAVSSKELDTSNTPIKPGKNRSQSFLNAARESFETGLANVRLDDKLNISTQGNTISASGKLTRVDRKRFERVLRNVVDDFGTEVVFRAEIASYEDAVPMVIKQVVGGQNPMVVLEDGSRLFVGSVYKGNIVESITTEKVVLRGRELIEVTL
jgi:hypothetical protein